MVFSSTSMIEASIKAGKKAIGRHIALLQPVNKQIARLHFFNAQRSATDEIIRLAQNGEYHLVCKYARLAHTAQIELADLDV